LPTRCRFPLLSSTELRSARGKSVSECPATHAADYSALQRLQVRGAVDQWPQAGRVSPRASGPSLRLPVCSEDEAFAGQSLVPFTSACCKPRPHHVDNIQSFQHRGVFGTFFLSLSNTSFGARKPCCRLSECEAGSRTRVVKSARNFGRRHLWPFFCLQN